MTNEGMNSEFLLRRQELHLSLRALAARIGCSHELVRKVEAGIVPASTPGAQRIAEALHKLAQRRAQC